jgi:DNA-binding transcriptional LysR family regulator
VNEDIPPVGSELDIRSLRYFVAVAGDLHFTTAAARLFVAQQALSRDIGRLERQLDRQLFVRTTRRVSLTPDGEQLLERARELLAVHDRLWRDLHAADARPIIVDQLSEGRLTGVRILDAARAGSPWLEFRGRFGGGVGPALERLRSGEIDVVLGRLDWLDQPPLDDIGRQLIRLEPLAVLLPVGHPLAELSAIPLALLRGQVIDADPATTAAPEWADLVRQFLALTGARPTPPHLPAVGVEEQGYHLVRQGLPILTAIDHVTPPNGVVRRLVDPTPLYAWSMAWLRSGARRGLDVLDATVASLRDGEGWLGVRDVETGGYWLPEPEASALISR